jgi:uncharacterized protein (DUF1330 family)
MTKAYWIATYRSVSDPDKLAAYAADAPAAIQAAGGKFLARGMPAAVIEAGENMRTVLIEFESLEAAEAAYASPAYQAALAKLEGGAVRDIRLVESV